MEQGELDEYIEQQQERQAPHSLLMEQGELDEYIDQQQEPQAFFSEQDETEYHFQEFEAEQFHFSEQDIESESEVDPSEAKSDVQSSPVRKPRGRPRKVHNAVSRGRPRTVPRLGDFAASDLDTLDENTIVYLDHGYMDKKCLYCGAYYFRAECNS